MIGIKKWSDCINKIRKSGGQLFARDTECWELLKKYQKEIVEHFAIEGYKLQIYESDGYAFLANITEEDVADWQHAHPESKVEFTYNVTKPHSELPYSPGQTVMLIILRQKMQAYREDMTSDICLVGREELCRDYITLTPEKGDEIRTINLVDKYIKDMLDDGFLRKSPDSDNDFIVNEIIERKVTLEMINDFTKILTEAAGGEGKDE